MAELLNRLGVGRAALVGHSMGGAIAMRFAAAYPERVDRLALVGSALPDERMRLTWYPLLRGLLPIPAALVLGNMRLLRRFLGRIVYDPAFITDDLWAEYTRPSRIRGSVACLVKMFGDARFDAPLPPARVSAPTLLIWGEADRVAPLHDAHSLFRRLPNVALEVVPRAGHLVLEEQPHRCSDLLLCFLRDGRAGEST
jgi:pimeloyl-ACP methyl ester carboxylesterase